MGHKYALGQGVVFSPGPGEIVGNNARGTITRLLPKDDVGYQYRIQLDVDGQERRVQEDQLRSVPDAERPAWPRSPGAVLLPSRRNGMACHRVGLRGHSRRVPAPTPHEAAGRPF